MKRKLVWVAVGVVALAVLLGGFGGAGGQLPLLLMLLLCPLLHLFGSHGHRDHRPRDDAGTAQRPDESGLPGPERQS